MFRTSSSPVEQYGRLYQCSQTILKCYGCHWDLLMSICQLGLFQAGEGETSRKTMFQIFLKRRTDRRPEKGEVSRYILVVPRLGYQQLT
jgi:uncharacterized Fe-S cluster-containing MiaB family protein